MEHVDLGFCSIGFDIEQDADGKPRAYIYAEWHGGRDRSDICRVSVADADNTLRCVVWDELRGLDTSYEADILVPAE